MKIFNGFTRFDWRSFFITRNMILIGIIVLLAIFYGQLNLHDTVPDNTVPDGKLEYKLVPPASSILFSNSGRFGDMSGMTKNGKIYISSDNDRKNPFSSKWNIDLAGLLLGLGSLLLMFYGSSAFKDRNFQRMCSNYLGLLKLYFYTLIARYLIVSSLFLAIILLGIAQILVSGIKITHLDYLQFLRFALLWLATSFFFLCLGGVIGMLKNRGNARLIIIGMWFLQIFFFPGVVNFLADLEQRFINNEIALVNDPERREIRSIDEWERYALATPSTTYLMMTQEMSNQGYADRLNFYRFIKNHMAQGDVKEPAVYYPVSLMPAHYIRGLVILSIYNLLALLAGFYALRRIFYRPDSSADSFQLDIKPGEHEVFDITSPEIVAQIWNRLFHPVSGLTCPVSGITQSPVFICAPEDFPPGVKVADLLRFMCIIAKVEDITDLPELAGIKSRTMEQLDESQKLKVLMIIARLKKSELYLFYNTVAGMEAQETLAFLRFTTELRHPVHLCRQGRRSSVIYLTTNPEIKFENCEETDIIAHNRYWTDIAGTLEKKDYTQKD